MPSSSASPVIVVSGLPRSGTSLVMQMLQAGGVPVLTDRQRGTDEDNPRGYFELERVKHLKTDKSWLDDAGGKAVKIIHMLLPELPRDREYRVLFLRRDLREVVRSQATMLQRSGRPGAGLPDEKLIAIYQAQLTSVEAWLARNPNVTVCDVSYADLIADPPTGARSIAKFLGKNLDVEAMSRAVDPSLHRNKAD